MEVAGPRGKSLFASKLGISASTYAYYESRRVPPAEILVRIADLAGADLRWLLTGESASGAAVPAGNPILHRAAALLSKSPQCAAPLAVFLDILAASLQFPAKAPQAQPVQSSLDEKPSAQAVPAATAESPPRVATPAVGAPVMEKDPSRQSWIPVLGRSAAGVPQFWGDETESAGVATMGDLVARHAARRASRVAPAVAGGGEGLRDVPVQIITLDAPDDSETAEYVASAEMKSRYPDAFAVRIDGESMSPEIRHGDLVVLSPSAAAADGRPAVVQLRRQIGVTCKLYRRQGDRVHLVPVCEQFVPQSFPAGDVLWALRVLATVRPARPGGSGA